MANRINTFLIKRSNTPGKVPTAGSLLLGEIALNTADAKLYTSGTTAGSILPIGWDRVSKTGDTMTGTLYGPSISATTIQTSGTYLNSNGITANTISATSINKVNYIVFNTGTTSAATVAGTVYFDNTEKALSYNTSINQGVTVNLGQQQYLRVFNNSGTSIAKGKALEILSAYSGLPSVTLAVNKHLGFEIVGVSAEVIPNNSEGIIITSGILSNISLTGISVGSLVYASDSVPGQLDDATKYLSFPLTARTNSIGYVVQTGATTGKLFVNIRNENSVLSFTDLERDILEGNIASTGVFTFSGITLATSTTFNVGAAQGWIIDNTTDPLYPDAHYIYYSGQTGLTTPHLLTATSTYILLNSGATLTLINTFPTPQQRRENIYLGKLGHANKTTLINAFNEADFDISPISQLRDVFTPIKLINSNIFATPNGTNLNFNTSAGVLWGLGIGFTINQLNPNSISVSGNSPTTFQYRTQTGGTDTNRTAIVPGSYDLNGVITPVGLPAKQATNQRIYLVQNGIFRIQYGQKVYIDLTTAVAAAQNETFTTFPNFRDNGILVGILSLRSDTTNLSDSEYAKFLSVSKFGEVMGGTGGLSTTTLQQAYNNSAQPEIVTNSTLGAVSIQNGTGSADNVTRLLEGENTAGNVTSFIRADGYISGTTLQTNGAYINNNGITATTISATTYLNLPISLPSDFFISTTPTGSSVTYLTDSYRTIDLQPFITGFTLNNTNEIVRNNNDLFFIGNWDNTGTTSNVVIGLYDVKILNNILSWDRIDYGTLPIFRIHGSVMNRGFIYGVNRPLTATTMATVIKINPYDFTDVKTLQLPAQLSYSGLCSDLLAYKDKLYLPFVNSGSAGPGYMAMIDSDLNNHQSLFSFGNVSSGRRSRTQPIFQIYNDEFYIPTVNNATQPSAGNTIGISVYNMWGGINREVSGITISSGQTSQPFPHWMGIFNGKLILSQTGNIHRELLRFDINTLALEENITLPCMVTDDNTIMSNGYVYLNGETSGATLTKVKYNDFTDITTEISNYNGGLGSYGSLNPITYKDTVIYKTSQLLNDTFFTGGTVSGATNFTGGLTANTISATTITANNISGTTNYVSKFTGSNSLGNSLIFDNATNVGIGTTAPSQKLEVSGGQIQIGDTTSSSTGLRFLRVSSTIQAAANYYIAAANSPAQTWVEGGLFTAERAGTVNTTNSGYPYYEEYFPNSTLSYKSFGFINSNSGTFTGTNMIPSIFLRYGGNVGIGTTAPNAKLHVSGDTIVQGNLYVTASTQSLFSGNSSTELIKIIQNGSGDAFVVQDIANGDASHFVINASGNTAIGLTQPLGNDKLTVSGDTSIYGLLKATAISATTITATTGLFSASTQNILKVIGSGNSTTAPIFSVQGSQGELFSITDSLTGSLFSVNDISGLPILEAFSDNTVLMGNYLAPSLNTTARVTAGVGLTNVYSIPTSAYTGAFFDYTINDGVNLRAGNVMGIWSGTTVQYTESSTNDIGNTSGLTFNMIISGSSAILRTSGVTGSWTVKAIVRSI